MKTKKEVLREISLFMIAWLIAFASIVVRGDSVGQEQTKVTETSINSFTNYRALNVENMALKCALEKVKELDESNYIGEFTTEQRDIVERVVAAEARGEDLQGQMAVANVIKDRAELWNMALEEVVMADGQFAKPYQGEISNDTKLAVANVFDKGIRVFKETVTHFASSNPYWAKYKINRGSIGKHTFYY